MKKFTFNQTVKGKISKLVTIVVGLGALAWFLIRVIPKPSRASYPCQQASFPIASAFVLWLVGFTSSYFGLKYLGKRFSNTRWLATTFSVAATIVAITWFYILPSNIVESFAATPADTIYTLAVGYDWKPGPSNKPIGIGRGIYPGRVVMTRNPEATKWEGNWSLNEDQWWLNENTDIDKVSEMLSVNLQKLTETKNDKKAWDKIFEYYNENSRGLSKRGYKKGETIAIKVNLNSSGNKEHSNKVDASPQMVLATVRQLVHNAGVPQNNILIYDAK